MRPTDAVSPAALDAADHDLGPLAWVLDELRKSLDGSIKAMRRHVREALQSHGAELASPDVSALRLARQQMHQATGALEMVGMAPVALMMRALEAMTQKFIQAPSSCTDDAIGLIERASFAISEYLEAVLAGHEVSAVSLFPQFRDVQQWLGVERIHPADLWGSERRVADPALPDSVVPLDYHPDVRSRFDHAMLKLVKTGRPSGARAMAQIASGLASAGTQGGRLFWKVAAGFFEGLSLGLVPLDVYVKRVISRVLVQYSALARGEAAVSERLFQDLLFYCAQACPADSQPAPLLRAVREAYGLQRHAPADYEARRFGRFDPAVLVQARKRIATATDTWSALAGGDRNKLRSAVDQFALVGESLSKLHPGSQPLGQALQRAAEATALSGDAPGASLAMEVATAVLFLQACYQEMDIDEAQMSERSRALAERLDRVLAGEEVGPLEPWMEELYRRVSDRQTMGSVVEELRSTLTEVEKSLDTFFRQPSDSQVLTAVPARLSQMRGVLSVLGLEQAAHAAMRMRDSVERLMVDEVTSDALRAGTFERLGNSLGALGFLIDMLSYQRTLARKLFVYDEEAGELKFLGGRQRQQFGPADASEALVEPPLFVDSLALGAPSSVPPRPLEAQPGAAPSFPGPASLTSAEPATLDTGALDIGALGDEVAAPSLPPPARTEAPAIEEDELIDVFLEEAREVFAQGGATIDALHHDPASLGDQTALRRAFHTLKGSSRMVGLGEFGEAAWALEQLHNAWLADQKPASKPLLTLSIQALNQFSRWVDDIAAHQAQAWRAAPFREAADALRLEDRLLPLLQAAAEGHEAAAVPTELPELPELPSLDLAEAAAPAPLPGAEPAAATPFEGGLGPDFDLSFDGLSLPQEPAVSTDDAPHQLDFAPTAMMSYSEDAPVEAAAEAEPATASFDVEDIDFAQFEAALAGAPAEPGLPAHDGAGAGLPALDLDLPGDTAEAASLADALPHFELDFPLEADAGPVSPALPASPLDEASLDAAVDAALDDELSRALEALPADNLAEPLPDLPLDVLDRLQADGLDELLPLPTETDLALEPALTEPGEVAQPEQPAEPEPEPEPKPKPELDADADADAASLLAPASDDESIRVIGDLRLSIPLYNVYLNEADEWSRRLQTSLGEWALELHEPVPDTAVALAHSLAGSSATVGFKALSSLARTLEHALQHVQLQSRGTEADARAFVDAADDIRRLLHQFAAGFLKEPQPAVVQALEAILATEAGVPMPESLALAEPSEWIDAPAQASNEPAFDELTFDEPGFAETGESPVAEPLAAPGAMDEEALPEPQLEAVPEAFAAPEALTDDLDAALSPEASQDLAPALASESVPDGAPELPQEQLTEAQLPADEALPEPLAAPEPLASEAAPERAYDDEFDAVDVIDPDLFPIFEEEALELLPRVAASLRHWQEDPAQEAPRAELLRLLHTLKGSARLAGALRLGEMAHRMESAIEGLAETGVDALALEALVNRFDGLQANFDALRGYSEAATEADLQAATQELSGETPAAAVPRPALPPTVQWVPQKTLAGQSVRVRSQLLDRLVNQAGEVMISRSRLESRVGQMRSSLGDLTGNLDRLRQQLRDIELQAESQMQSRLALAKDSDAGFDPLEFDRFTRVQELTRMMAESVNDVAMVQRNLQRTVDSTEDELVAQARQARELQRDLLRTRMVEFDGIAERLYAIARQSAKETGKQIKLDITGGSIEMDRGVLDRMTPAFEHLLRNAVAHGIESPDQRAAAGKPATGSIGIQVTQSGNDVSVEFADDGAGLDLAAIGERAQSQGLMAPGHVLSEDEAAQMIFMPGFTTASEVTELAGRGIGMDVVRTEVNALGGRIETRSRSGQGSRFKLVLPLTTAVTQVVMLRIGQATLGVPASLVEIVRRSGSNELDEAYRSQQFDLGVETVPFYWGGALLQLAAHSQEAAARTRPVVIFHSAAQRIAVHVDEVLGNQEVVVKNLGPQLSRLPGLAGMSVLASGAVVMIYNPVALANVYGEQIRARLALSASAAAAAADGSGPVAEPAVLADTQAPLVLVVDDSITVRRVTQRLLQREGYRVTLAADGLQALERLQDERPVVVLSDIEMPRMDGFDLARNIRHDAALRELPIIMITSRIAAKHREHALELGVNHYLGKPYAEEELLSLVRHYAGQGVVAEAAQT
ncbi:MAG: Hpt domain-containing protein [Curvibacter lanceolatus]|uniref:Hpt domain-containing protein n=1 Tax=Curvibacter lanceolatus TaxID=86182 RepID=UPI0003794833|nr:Hpt domain-containing protein [Curvibacter lanceolatus]MBV5295560.1 Hpt domain-containing protein [Curvibacter lanceolatus]